jgi:hypothetical protein
MSSHGAWSATQVGAGTPTGAADDRIGGASVVLGHRLWKRAFGVSPEVVGRSVRLLMGSQKDARAVGLLPPARTHVATA